MLKLENKLTGVKNSGKVGKLAGVKNSGKVGKLTGAKNSREVDKLMEVKNSRDADKPKESDFKEAMRFVSQMGKLQGSELKVVVVLLIKHDSILEQLVLMCSMQYLSGRQY